MKAIFFLFKSQSLFPRNKVLQIIVDRSIFLFENSYASRENRQFQIQGMCWFLSCLLKNLNINFFLQSLLRWFTFKLSSKMFFLEHLLRICIRLNKHIRSIQISFDHCSRKYILGIVISSTVRSNAFFVRYQLIRAMFIVCSHASGGFCKLMNQKIFIDIISVWSSKMTPPQRPTCIIYLLHFNDCIKRDASQLKCVIE